MVIDGLSLVMVGPLPRSAPGWSRLRHHPLARWHQYLYSSQLNGRDTPKDTLALVGKLRASAKPSGWIPPSSSIPSRS